MIRIRDAVFMRSVFLFVPLSMNDKACIVEKKKGEIKGAYIVRML